MATAGPITLSNWETHPQIRQVSAVSVISSDTEISHFEPSPSSTRTVEPNQSNGDSRAVTNTPESQQPDCATQIPGKRLTLLTLEDEREPRFEAMPDSELDRLIPVTAHQSQHFEPTPLGAPAPPEATSGTEQILRTLASCARS